MDKIDFLVSLFYSHGTSIASKFNTNVYIPSIQDALSHHEHNEKKNWQSVATNLNY